MTIGRMSVCISYDEESYEGQAYLFVGIMVVCKERRDTKILVNPISINYEILPIVSRLGGRDPSYCYVARAQTRLVSTDNHLHSYASGAPYTTHDVKSLTKSSHI